MYPFDMRRLSILLSLFLIAGINSAVAHQPVFLLDSDTTASKGPLLVDGTVSFAIRASFNKAGERKGFRADLKAGEQLSVQYLIVDKKPDNALKISQLPQVVITAPNGARVTLRINERTKFYEPYGKTNYLYLARYSAVAQAGTYSFLITSRAKSAITVAVGDREVPGEVLRGAAPVATAKPTPTATPTPSVTPKPTPSPTATVAQSAYTMEEVKKRNTAASCWSVIDGKVYDLTRWIPVHRGGPQAITFLCGKDGTSAFKAQHDGASSPASVLPTYLLGPLAP
jgi:cytochrome b involved in lipid metabolism